MNNFEEIPRKTFFYLPNVTIDESITISGVKFSSIRGHYDLISILPSSLSRTVGVLVEPSGFISGDHINPEYVESAYFATEALKYSYFSMNILSAFECPGFITDNTFEMFHIISRHSDASIEHKIPISNGTSIFQISQDIFFSHRLAIGGISNAKLSAVELQLFEFCYENKNDESIFIPVYLYNKCRKASSPLDYFDTLITARTSFELLIKNSGVPKSKGILPLMEFLYEKMITFIINNKDIYSEASPLYLEYIEIVRSQKSTITENLRDYYKKLKDARDKQAHEGILRDSISLDVYLITFPWLFYSLYFEKINPTNSARVLLLLYILTKKPTEWNHTDKPEYFVKKSISAVYAEASKYITNQFNKKEHQNIHNHLQSVKNALMV